MGVWVSLRVQSWQLGMAESQVEHFWLESSRKNPSSQARQVVLV